MTNTLYDVVAIGNAVVDVLAKIGEGFLTERNLTKGEMTLVDAKKAGEIYADIIPEREVSGGSSANTVAGLASLGLSCAFIGKVHDDELGQTFSRDIGVIGVDFETIPLHQGPSTARSIVLITPDAKRSMFTYLGASQKLSVEDIDENVIKNAKFLYLEGYLWENQNSKDALIKACKIAHDNDRRVAFSLSDKSVVIKFQPELLAFVKEYVDILFGNEEEVKALLKKDDVIEASNEIKDTLEILAITRGEKGSIIIKKRIKTIIEAETVENVVDTTGAGDAFAAGFLYGFLTGRSLGTCATIGNIIASEVISHYGARAEVSLRGFIRNKLEKYNIKPI